MKQGIALTLLAVYFWCIWLACDRVSKTAQKRGHPLSPARERDAGKSESV